MQVCVAPSTSSTSTNNNHKSPPLAPAAHQPACLLHERPAAGAMTGAVAALSGAADAAGPAAAAAAAAAAWLALLPAAHAASLRASASYRQSGAPTRADWLSRVNSNAHALGATAGFYAAVFCEPPGGLHDGGPFAARALFRVLLYFGLGYFLADALIVLRFAGSISSPGSTLAHHALCALSVLYVLAQDMPLTYVWCGLMFLTEASTPFVNQRFFMAIRHREQRRYMLTGTLMTVAFVVVRPVGIPLMLAWMWRQPALFTTADPLRLPTIYRAGLLFTGVLYGLNVYWSYLMVSGLLRAVKRKARGEKVDNVIAPHVGATRGASIEAAATEAASQAAAVTALELPNGHGKID